MGEEKQWPPEGRSRRWDDTPNVVEFRVLALEKTADDHEVRLRAVERSMNAIEGLASDVSEIKDTANNAATEGRRNRFTIIASAVTVVLTIVGAHFFK